MKLLYMLLGECATKNIKDFKEEQLKLVATDLDTLRSSALRGKALCPDAFQDATYSKEYWEERNSVEGTDEDSLTKVEKEFNKDNK